LLVLVLVTTVACPWYLQYAELELDHMETSGKVSKLTTCSVARLTSWRTEYCAVQGDCANTTVVSPIFKNITSGFLCPEASYNWRSDKTKNVSNLFDIGIGLATLSLLCSVISCLGFFIRCCCRDTVGKSYLLITVTLFGFLSLGVSVVYFGLKLPGAYSADDNCATLPTGNGKGPCFNYFGGEDRSTPSIGGYYGDLQIYWGPVGWAVGVVGLPIYLLVLCLSCTRAGGYRSINDGSGGAYVRHQTTGVNYV